MSESIASHSAAIIRAIGDDVARGRHRRRRRRSHVEPSSAAFKVLLIGNAAEDGRQVILESIGCDAVKIYCKDED